MIVGYRNNKMSAVSTSKPKKSDPMNKKIPENPKYKHVRSTLDTGHSITKYMEKIEDIRKNYRYKKDEVFKRMKVTTFVQLILQVADYENRLHTHSADNGMGDRPDTADFEVLKIQQRGSDSPTPSLAVTEGDYGAPPPERTSRSTLQGVIRGVGEVDINKEKSRIPPPEILFESGSPYLLLDIRDHDAYDQCHIITALNYPTAMLSRSVNYETKEMLSHKNQPGKIILIYDEDERSAPSAASTLVERGYDNLFMLSGGMRIAYKSFPEGLFTGTPNQNVTESSKPPAENLRATKKTFDQSDLNNLGIYLDNALSDRSVGSRLSKATTASSRMSGSYSQLSAKTTASTGSVSGRPPFKP